MRHVSARAAEDATATPVHAEHDMQVLAEPEAAKSLTMNDRYFFGLLERMTSGALTLLLL